MNRTYTVIIQSQRTMESFSQYQLLFADAVRSGRIGVCKWIESGTTVETALPELSSLTDDKQEWRAVIVRYADGDCMEAYGTAARNPYDFEINRDGEEQRGESPVPLVRLTQMLGGVPPREIQFRTEVVREAHKAPRTVYVPIEDGERERVYRELVRKYRFDGKLPASVLLVTVRDSGYRDEERLDRSWEPHRESESSEFWKRNHFPSGCRFLVYDFKAQGPIQREADSFGFWYAVMLLSTNEWDSGTIQAYRLYTVRTVMDRPAMTQAFQDLADRLRDAKRSLERSIRQDIEDGIYGEEPLPEYRMEVSVPVRSPDLEACLPSSGPFRLLSAGVATDVANWTGQRKKAEETLEASVRSAGRALDQTADRLRDTYTLTEDMVTPLNPYQEEDIRRELEECYSEVVELQGKLPDEDVSRDEGLQEAARSVWEYLLGRVERLAALAGPALAAVLLALAAAPAVVERIADKTGSAAVIAAAVGGIVLCALLAAALALLWQKLRLDRLIRRYVRLLKEAFNELTEQAGDYSTYMSRIGSHQRGSSYLDVSTRKKGRSGAEHSMKYRHITAINLLLGKLRKWGKAYRLEVDYTTPRPENPAQAVEVDVTAAPMDNRAYAFDAQTVYPVAVNRSGMWMESPYPFAGRIEIVREELYDDDDGHK